MYCRQHHIVDNTILIVDRTMLLTAPYCRQRHTAVGIFASIYSCLYLIRDEDNFLDLVTVTPTEL